ncbi:MAG: hypothetical protein GXY81_00715 [Candidatus Cloacimonetes bacterium]|jgi:hypothetical protein|nr:hypothetical protein [Candidatus Cloacimonadota bacterium]MDX9949259.1 hypothetical protein [Candidatus Syntrophosphaera sp.]NLN85691.1 hypothetical protein [Candidatus Cloacimonadota bacterium]NLW18202.1 hypothetical protein [Candidatus Cloacimonadota bacterium]
MKKAVFLLAILVFSIALNAFLYDSVSDLERRARAGDERAQFTLGLKYGNGDGVARNNNTAYFWVLIADAFGYNDQHGIITFMASKLSAAERAQVQNSAVEWIRVNPNYYSSDKNAAINWIRTHGANFEYLNSLLQLK